MRSLLNTVEVNNKVEKPSKNKINFLAGKAAIEMMSDRDFVKAWEDLFQSCPWSTIFQSPDFVIEWYNIFHESNTPILFYCHTEGKLSGILTLAQRKEDGDITAAGRNYAHYQTWISEEHNKESFILNALHEIRVRFSNSKIYFTNLPPNAPINWIKSDPYWSRYCTFKPLSRPVLKLTGSEIGRLNKKKQFRQNRNRLQKVGSLRLEKITQTAHFESILDELALQYDFRQGAAHNRTPFESDPLKKVFYINLFKQNLLFVTVLWSGKDLVASIISTKGVKGYIHGAGINTQSPLYSKFSPGFLNFIMLFEQLFNEGYKYVDFATGEQSYKNRMTGFTDTVYRVVFYPNSYLPTVKRASFQLNRSLLLGMEQVNIDIRKLKGSFHKNSILFKERLSLIKSHGVFPWLKYRFGSERNKEVIGYEIKDGYNSFPEGKAISINNKSIGDLLDYEPDETLYTKWEFLYNSMKRVESGEISFTWTLNGKLMACVWLTDNDNGIIQNKGTNKEISLLQGLYVHKNGRKSLGAFLSQVKEEAFKIKPNQHLYLLAKGDINDICPNLDVVHF